MYMAFVLIVRTIGPMAKRLSAHRAREIRASDESNAVLAERYGVSTSTIRDVRFGRKWKRAGGRILTPSNTNGVKWEPDAAEIDRVIAALSVRGSWADGAEAAGVSVPTLKAFARRSVEAELFSAAMAG